MRFIAPIVLFVIVISAFTAPVSAASVSISFDKQQLQAKYVLSLHQNITSFPNQAILLDASSDSNMSNAILAALRNADPSASFTKLNIGVSSSPSWLNLTLLMNLAGIYENRGSVTDLNMTWKAFYTNADLRAGSFSYNTVGSTYFRPVVEFYQNASTSENRPNATVQGVTFFVNGTESVAGTTQANSVGNFTLLDFRSLDLPLDQWNRTYSLTNNTSSWRYRPAEILNVSLRVQELNKTFTLASQFGFDAEISVPSLALAQGNVIRADAGTGLDDWIMLVVVIVFVALAAGIQVAYRRRKSALRMGRR